MEYYNSELDDLINRLDDILIKNRCSFSDDEVKQLEACKMFLIEAKKKKEKSQIDIGSILVKVVEVIIRLFSDFDGFSNF